MTKPNGKDPIPLDNGTAVAVERPWVKVLVDDAGTVKVQANNDPAVTLALLCDGAAAVARHQMKALEEKSPIIQPNPRSRILKPS